LLAGFAVAEMPVVTDPIELVPPVTNIVMLAPVLL